MKVVMTLLVRDEEDILEANLRFHEAAGVDFFIVTDNASVDRTSQILQAWVERGRAQVIREEQDDYAQSVWVTRMSRLAATEHGADWVINADADEFLQPRRGTLRDALATLPREVGQLLLPRVDFPPTLESERLVADGVPFWRAMQVREVTSRSPLGVPLPPKVLHRAHEAVVVEQGNHAVHGVPWPAPDAARTPITILHVPRRTYAQFERKIRLGGAAYARNRTLGPEVGSTWRALYEMLEAGTLRKRYDEDVLDDDALRSGIDAGTHVLDRRLATRLDALLGGSPEREPRIGRVRAIGRIGVVVDYEELVALPELLDAWGTAFEAADPVTLVVHAPGRNNEQVQAELVPVVEAAGLAGDDAADILVAATPGGAEDRREVDCRVVGRYAMREPRLVAPGDRSTMRAAVLGEGASTDGDARPTPGANPDRAAAIVDIAMGIEGHLTPVECRTIVSLAGDVRSGAIVEVGSFRGRSTTALALAAGAAVEVYAIDPHAPFVGEHGGVFGPADRVAFFRNLLDAEVVERVRLVNLPSVDAAAGFSPTVDLLWLDGDHSDAGVEADFLAWERTLRTGGVVAFHDALDPSVGPGRVAGAAVASGRYELVEQVDKVTVIRRVAAGRR